MTQHELVDVRADDNFNGPLDDDVWYLLNDAVKRSGEVCLTNEVDSARGQLVCRNDVTANVIDITASIRITTSANSNVKVFLAATDIGSGRPEDGYEVGFYRGISRVRIYKYENGSKQLVDEADLPTMRVGVNNIAVRYERGGFRVRLNGTQILTSEQQDVTGNRVAFEADTSNSNPPAHYVTQTRIWQPLKRNLRLAESLWDYGGINFGRQTNTYRLVRALMDVIDSVDYTLEDARRAHHIDTASGQQLDKIGKLVGLDRKTDEPDQKYRSRLKVQFRVGNLEPTFDNFAQLTAAALNADIGVLDFDVSLGADPATVTVSAPPDVYDANVITPSEAGQFLGDAVPAGHEVKMLESGTLRLKEDGQTDNADKGLTADNINTGGTLATDV